MICGSQTYAGLRTYSFKYLSDNIALKQSNVNCIYQDGKGLMYFGTNEGLFLYDGYTSELCWNTIRAGAELTSNNILSITELDGSKRLLSTSDGLYVFDIFTRRFMLVEIQDEPGNNAKIFRINNVFYLVSASGIGKLIIDERNQQYEADYHSCNALFERWIPGEPLNITSHYYGQSGKVALAVNGNQMYSWNPVKNQLTKEGIQGQHILCLLEDRQGNTWAGSSDNKVFFRNAATGDYHTIHLRINKESYGFQKNITSICEDNEGNILIGSNNNGLALIRSAYKYDRYPPIEYYNSEPDNTNSICDNNVSCLFCDRSNAIFIGTQGNGINQLSLGQACFKQHIIVEDDSNSPDHIRVNAIYDDNNGTVWFGTRLGLNKFSRQSGRYTRYHDLLPGDNNYIPREVGLIGETTCFCKDSIGNLWIGTYGTGLFMYSEKEKRFYQFKDSEGQYSPSYRITDVTIGPNGRLWIATHGAGMARVDSVNLNAKVLYYQPFRCDEVEPEGPSNQFVDVIITDINNNMWFTNRGRGLFRYNLETSVMDQFEHVPGDTTSLSNNSVISICRDKDGNLWFGTARGLNKFDINKEYFTSYTMERGLPHNSICGVLSDESGNIWLYTQRGIYRFNPLSETFNRFIENSRIVHEDYTIDATCRNEAGTLFLGTINNGCFEFHPDSIKDNLFVPDIAMTDFKISGRSLLKEESSESPLIGLLDGGEVLELNHRQNDFSIEYTACAYHTDLNLRFSYLMDGVDKEWHTTNESKLSISYANLNPGKYTFRVRAINSLRPDQNKEERISIIIHPPYWATAWAYLVYVILLVILVGVLYRYTMSRIRLKNDLKLERMKLGLFTNISHEFRTPLTLIEGPLKKLMAARDSVSTEERKRYYSLMYRNTYKLLKLVNQILDIRKVDNRKMSLMAEESDIITFSKEVFNSFCILAHYRGIRYLFINESDAIQLWYDRDKMEKVLYNLLSNAFKYTPDKGTITFSIHMSVQSNQLQISVEDSGKGIPDNQLNHVFNRFYRVEDSSGFMVNGTGLGLSIVRTFTEMHAGRVDVTNNEGPGCTFTLSLPLGDQHLSEHEKKKAVNGPEKKHLPDKGYLLSEDEASIKNEAVQEADKHVPLVLIVEDNAELRSFIKGELKHTYRIMTAENGRDGLEKAVEAFPDLIVSDVMMPEMDGLEFCKRVKEDVRICHIPIVLLTARSSGDQQIEGIETGADAYITKPFDPAYLEARIRNLITSRQQLKEAFTSQPDQVSSIQRKTSNHLDNQFIEKATNIVISHLEDPEFSVPDFTMQMGMSNSVFYRKLKALTNLSAGEFIKHIRMQKALELLNQRTYTVAEIATKVGFNDPKYFSTSFRKTFGQSPKHFLGDK
ncbi:MAG: ATP-binding protein [Bacteroidales bacterium]|nr:ATP-binding protein [Bacteroidales bacterium]